MATLLERIRQAAAQHPERLALVSPAGGLRYGDLPAAIDALAQSLDQAGMRRIGLCGDNTLAWVLADLACLQAGVVCVPVPGFFSPAQVAHLTAQAGLDAMLHGEPAEGAQPLGQGIWWQPLPEECAGARLPADTAKITFTSGSTGTPKGVCLSLAQMTATSLALQSRLARMSVQRHLCLLPLATLLENIAGVYLPLLMGATVTVAPLGSLGMTGSSGLDAGRMASALNQHRPQSLILVPQLALALVVAAEQRALNTSGFEFLAVGGGRVSPDLLRRGRATGLPLYEGYGLSECGSVVALNVPGDDRPGTVGKPLPHVRVTVDDNGHIRVRSNSFLGYLGQPGATETSLDTGDLGDFDEAGYLRVSGRAKDLLITSFGRNISPEWLESELTQALGVRQAVVFGDGEPRLSALLVQTGHWQPEALRVALDRLNSTLPDYARLAQVFVRHRPLSPADGHLTPNGRPVRHRIRQDLPALLAEATRLDSATAAKFAHSRSSPTPGGTHMAFFDRLQTETAEARAHVLGAPVITAVRDGRFNLGSYTWFLTQAFHHVKHTVPLMMACGARLPERLEFVRKALVEYIKEEYGHHEWILDDLAACGENQEVVRHGRPHASIELMVAYLYDVIERGNPIAFFGMVQVLEGTSVELATPLGQAVQRQLKLPDQAFSYLYSHGALDQEHFDFFRDLMNRIEHPEDQQAIIEAARMVYQLYGDMLHSIPLLQRAGEPNHEAA
ncbi:MAG: AMP-binding protein [Pseudomonadota bacterium]|nr:AMP-binding protein [Pseudomonadota bacterium]